MIKFLKTTAVIATGAMVIGYIAADMIRPATVYAKPVEVQPDIEIPLDELWSEEYYDDLELIAICVEAEAENQSKLGKKLVVDVILNRVDSPHFPDTVAEVLAQPHQFTVFENGRADRVEPSAETYQAVIEELEYRTDSEIVFFGTSWSKYGVNAFRVDDHFFSNYPKG